MSVARLGLGTVIMAALFSSLFFFLKVARAPLLLDTIQKIRLVTCSRPGGPYTQLAHSQNNHVMKSAKKERKKNGSARSIRDPGDSRSAIGSYARKVSVSRMYLRVEQRPRLLAAVFSLIRSYAFRCFSFCRAATHPSDVYRNFGEPYQRNVANG